MVRVCDAVMGTGKSQSAITYMNEHPDDKFIYITPYLDEAARIKKGCPSMKFIEPSNKLSQFHFKKSEHTASLIKEGRNITTTHQAFKGYTQETLEDIQRIGYTLIIDENVEVLEAFDFHPNDLQFAVDAGYVSENNGVYSLIKDDYSGKLYNELFHLLRSRELIRIDDGKTDTLFFWTLPPELITSFKDVFILTYLFSGQSLCHFLNIHNIPFEYIGIERTNDGNGFRFGEYPGYTPEYIMDLRDKLHIIDTERINNIGEEYYALSMNWYKKNPESVKQLKKNVSNWFNNICREIPAEKRLWASYNGEFNKIKGKGYTRSFLTFNAKATNEYRDKTCLVYLVNLFMNVNEKLFYQMHGIEVNEDMFALSIMIQWIWRSAIRDGEEVYLYIPSKRMKNLLTQWIEDVSKGGNTIER